MHELNTKDIEKQELLVKGQTIQKLAGFCDYFNDAIDILICLYYRYPKIADVNSVEGGYLSQLGYWFYMSIFSFRSAFILMEEGYYLEANIICRSIIETYIKMRFFGIHMDILQTFEQPHLNPKKAPSIKFFRMFEEVLPGYYDVNYRWLLSHMAHGGVGSLLFKVDISGGPKNIKADQGVVFNEERASFVMNNLTSFMFGYLRIYERAFPEIIKGLEVPLKNDFFRVEGILEKSFNEHIKLKGGENKWHKTSRQIWDF